MAAETQLTIINQARTLAGEGSVTAVGPVGSADAMADAAASNYEAIVLEELETGSYLFGRKTATPTLASTNLALVLPYGWTVPSDSLGIIAVRYLDQPLSGVFYSIEGQVVFVKYGVNITFTYKFRPDESLWPRRFTTIIVRRLAAVLMRVTERHTEAMALDQETERLAQIARYSEASQRKDRGQGDGSLVLRRQGQ